MRAAVALSVLLLAGSVAAVDFAQFISDPKFKLFLQKAMATVDCLTDPAVTTTHTLDLDLCPSLLGMLEALNNGASDYPVVCEPVCSDSFYTLSTNCLTQLTAAFNADTAPIGVLGSKFLAECKDLHDNPGAPPAPEEVFAPSPAPGYGLIEEIGAAPAPDAQSSRKLKQ